MIRAHRGQAGAEAGGNDRSARRKNSDGTGAPAREGTLVIEKTRCEDFPAGATDWPKDAQVIDVSGKTVLPG